MLKIIVLMLLTEALVELFFKAAPLQGIRNWLIEHTPFLDTDYGHLFECKYCVSVWMGFGVFFLATFADCALSRFMAYAIITARASNFVHITFGTLKDFQMNLRLGRK